MLISAKPFEKGGGVLKKKELHFGRNIR